MELHAKIAGKVQGVGFRAFTKKKAEEIGVFGYVENTPQGEVEVLAQGEEEDLQELASRLRQGPYFARVEDIDLDWSQRESDSFSEFIIEPQGQ